MSKTIFNEHQMKQLEANPNVVKVSEKSITYSPDFKVKAVKQNLEGKGPYQIFSENGFDMEVIGVKKPQKCLGRWRETYNKFGEEGFYTERRGKGATGRPSSKELTTEEQLEKAKARIAYLEAQYDFVKKLDKLERQAKKRKN